MKANLLDIIRGHCKPLQPVPTGLKSAEVDIAPFRVVVFDVYGTLLISGTGDISLADDGDRSAILCETMQDNGFAINGTPPLAEILHRCIRVAQEKIRKAGVEWPEVEIREVWDAFLQHCVNAGLVETPQAPVDREVLAVDYECRVNPVWPMPGMTEVLDSIRASGKLLGIVSNAQFFTPMLFEALTGKLPSQLGFCESRCEWSYKVREGKPSTGLYSRLAGRLWENDQIRPGEVLYIGNDIRNDIWPAAQIGFRTTLFAGDQRSLRRRENDPDCRNVHPDFIISDLRQLR